MKYKKLGKFALGAGGAATLALVGHYSLCLVSSELIFNRNIHPSEKMTKKISDGDTSHLKDFLSNNLKWIEDYGYETHYITSDRGERLTGYLLKAKSDTGIYAFCAHGYRSYGKKEFCGVCQHYLERGINVFFPDHVASGNSEGTYCTFGYYEKEDCFKWLNYLLKNFGNDIKILLHGVSMGGAIVCMMSERKDLPENVKCIVEDCGYTDAKDFFALKLEKLLHTKSKFILNSMSWVNKKRIGFYYDEIKPVESVKNTRIPILFIHGDKDNLVPCDMVYELYNACSNEGKELLVVEGADHAQAYFIGGKTYTDKLDTFLEKHIL